MAMEALEHLVLSLPFYKQTEIGYCYPSCLKMVIDHAIDNLGIKQKRLSLKKIARALGTHKLAGTIPENVELINQLLTESVPQIQFKSQISARFDEIRKELDERKPVIAWINIAQDKSDLARHSIVVIGYNLEKNEIYFVDPEMTVDNHVKNMDIGVFIDEKLGVEARIIKLIISQIGQKDLLGKIVPYERREKTK